MDAEALVPRLSAPTECDRLGQPRARSFCTPCEMNYLRATAESKSVLGLHGGTPRWFGELQSRSCILMSISDAGQRKIFFVAAAHTGSDPELRNASTDW